MAEIENITGRVSEGHRPRQHGPYSIEIGEWSEDSGKIEYQASRLEDPVPTGRQVLIAVGARPVEEHLVFRLMPSGDLEELRLDETTDLRDGETVRFLVFRSTESFRITIDNRRFEWGARSISGLVLKQLVDVPQEYGIWLEVRGGQDKPIGDADLVNLEEQGLERFFTGISQTTEGAV